MKVERSSLFCPTVSHGEKSFVASILGFKIKFESWIFWRQRLEKQSLENNGADATTLAITTSCITTLCIMTFGMTTLSIMTPALKYSDENFNLGYFDDCHYSKCLFVKCRGAKEPNLNYLSVFAPFPPNFVSFKCPPL